MNKAMKVFVIFLLIIFVCPTIRSFSENDAVKMTIASLKSLKNHRITVQLGKFGKKTSSTTLEKLIRELISSLPCSMANKKTFVESLDRNSTTMISKPKRGRNLMLYVITLAKLTRKIIDRLIIIADRMYNINLAKILFVLISDEKSTNLRTFFELAWTRKILDVTIIEIVGSKGKIGKKTITRYTINVHRYDPFAKIYERKNLTSVGNLFELKLRDLHGLNLKVGAYINFPQVVVKFNNNTKNLWDMFYGIDVNIVKLFSERMNFSIKLAALKSNNDFYHKFYNVSNDDIEDSLKNERIDFLVNLEGASGGILKNKNLFTMR